LHTIYPDLSYLSMKTHVSPYILRHWQALGIDKKGDNVKWKKHILDAIWHGDSFFESGTSVLKQTGVWRLLNPKADPWLDSPTSSPVPRRKNLPPKRMRSSPTFNLDEFPQEFATSEPTSPPLAQRTLSHSAPNIPQALPHISHLLRHVDDYWNSRTIHKSPPLHRRATNMSYSPYRSPPLESRFATSPPSPMAISSPCSSPVPTVNLIPAINSIPTNPPTNINPISTSIPGIALSPKPTSPSPTIRSQVLPQISSFSGNAPLLLESPFSTPNHSQPSATDGNIWIHSGPTRALHMLPCVSSLFQPPPLLPSIFPTS